jgi:iron(III) transport system ATP-binding protein
MSGIVLTNVTRRYDGNAALRGVSLHAPEGRVLALLGPSGSGKSTILRLVAGLEPLDEGEIRIAGELCSTPTNTAPPEARRIGMVFQDFALFPHMTAGANVAFGLDKLARAERDETAMRWLDRVGLKHRAGAYPHEMSGGEQQRVALARALAPKPRAMLLDEPFSGLDAMLRAELRDATLTALAEARVTTLFVTHDAEDALQIADALAILKTGRLLQQAAPRDAYDRPASADVAAALGPVNTFAGRVEGAAVATPFGAVPAPGLAEGAPASVVVRAEAVRLEAHGQIAVRDLRPHGAHDLVRIEANGLIWRALAPPRAGLGERVRVSLDPAGSFVFPG